MAEEEDGITLIDVSGYIMESEQDVGERQYRIALHCMDENKVDKSAEPVCEITGSSARRLTVTIDNKVYYRKKLPGSATKCEAQVKKEDLVILTIAKRDHGKWKK